MTNKYDVYLHGMVLVSNSFLLKDKYPEPDTYGEIAKRYRLPGGETGTCATVLSGLGLSCRIDGTHIGKGVWQTLSDYYSDKSVDLSLLTRVEDWDGLEDYVLIDKDTRTPFGTFQQYYSSGERRWNTPTAKDIEGASVAGIDPYFDEATLTAARLCKAAGVPYVTIDCPCDGELHKNAAITVLSHEFFRSAGIYGRDPHDILGDYMNSGDGLCIITAGSGEILYGRMGETHTFMPYSVDVVSTLGAGDTFKAGCVYGLYKGMSDHDIVEFASALAGTAVTAFPIPLNRPTLDKVNALIATRR